MNNLYAPLSDPEGGKGCISSPHFLVKDKLLYLLIY